MLVISGADWPGASAHSAVPCFEVVAERTRRLLRAGRSAGHEQGTRPVAISFSHVNPERRQCQEPALPGARQVAGLQSKTAPEGPFASNALVAGAGFEPATFGL